MDNSNLFVEVEDVLTCSICGERYRDPKTLRCDHTFCAECIEKHHTESSEGNQAFCPLCREPFIFCQAGSSFLRPSLPIVKLLELLEQNERKNTTLALQVCQISYHCKDSGATSFCPRCNKCMCDECAKAHSHLLRDHEVNPLKIFQNFDLIDDFVCPQHDGKIPYLRCISCDTIMCDICKSKHDESHTLKSVEQMKSEISEIRKSVISTKHHLEKKQHDYRTTDTIMRMSEGKAWHALSKSYKEIKGELKKNKTKLELDLQKHSADFQKIVAVKIKDTESRLNKTSKFIDLIDRLFSSGSERHLLEYWPDIQTHLNEISDYDSIKHEETAQYDVLEKTGVEFKPIEGLKIGSITKTKAYEDWFGNFKQKDNATKSPTELEKEMTPHPEDHVTKQRARHIVDMSTIVHRSTSEEENSSSVYYGNEESKTATEQDARRIVEMPAIVHGSKRDIGSVPYENEVTTTSEQNGRKCGNVGMSVIVYESKTEDGNIDSVPYESEIVTTTTDEYFVEEMLLEGNTIYRLNAAISGAVVYQNTLLFLVSFKSDKIYVIDIEKCQLIGERRTVQPFDVAATRDGDLGEVLLVTCHKGGRKRCRIEKYRDGELDSIFTRKVSYPCGITIMDDNDVCVCESNPFKKLNQLKIFDFEGNLKKKIQRSIFKCPSYLTCTLKNELLVSDIEANCVWCLKNCEIGYPTVVYGESDIEPRKATIFDNYIFVAGKGTDKSRVFDQQGQQICEVRIKNETRFVNPAVLADSGRSLICISETGTVVSIVPREYESMFMTKL